MVDPPMAVVRVESSSEGGGAVRPDAAADIRLLAAPSAPRRLRWESLSVYFKRRACSEAGQLREGRWQSPAAGPVD
eukprot:jgi/Tetstr1/438404/TSEL_026970.t1